MLIYNKKYYIDSKINSNIDNLNNCNYSQNNNIIICNDCNGCNDCNDDGCTLFLIILILVWIPLIIFIKGKEILVNSILQNNSYNIIQLIRFISLLINIMLFLIIFIQFV